MKKIIIFLTFICSFELLAFTLLQRNPPRYPDRIVIRPGDSGCANAGLSAPQLREFIQRAIDDYWNSVPTARAHFVIGDALTIGASATTDEMVALASVGEIVVGCSDNTTTFTDGRTLALGGMSTTQARGVVAINNTADTRFNDVDELARVSTFAHELGHAIGIGHSPIDYSLMYYSVTAGVVNEHLTEDDADAFTYLYPKDKKAGGLLGACGTISFDNDDDNNGPLQFVLTLIMGFLCINFVRKISFS